MERREEVVPVLGRERNNDRIVGPWNPSGAGTRDRDRGRGAERPICPLHFPADLLVTICCGNGLGFGRRSPSLGRSL